LAFLGALAGPIIGAVGGIASSLIGGHAASSAANAQSASAQAGIDEMAREFNITQGNEMPWITGGQGALGGQLDLLGVNGGAKQQAAINALLGGPQYQSEYRQGTQAILQNASATGGLRGGNTEHSLANFGSDLLAQLIQQQFGNLGSISGLGAGVAGNLGALSGQNASGVANLLGQQGAAKAGGILGSAQGWTGALGGLTSFLQTPGLFGGGGGSGGGVVDLTGLPSSTWGF
jgi:hypothetical protein